jgi:hypothetical protein
MFDPRDFHVYAVESSTGTPDEAACRSAISRAYYAAYLVALQYVRSRKIRAYPPPDEYWGSHQRIIHAVGEIRHPGARVIERDLDRLKRLRVSADYHLEYTGASRQMADAIQDAARVIAWIDALP